MDLVLHGWSDRCGAWSVRHYLDGEQRYGNTPTFGFQRIDFDGDCDGWFKYNSHFLSAVPTNGFSGNVARFPQRPCRGFVHLRLQLARGERNPCSQHDKRPDPDDRVYGGQRSASFPSEWRGRRCNRGSASSVWINPCFLAQA